MLTTSTLSSDLATVAEQLRRITVQVRNQRMGDGSGIVWGPDGLIVTNAHVARSRAPAIELWDGRVLQGRLQWRDPRRDLALLAIPATGLPQLALGDAKVLRPGEIVLALGHPFGLVNALAVGVVHELRTDTRRDHWIRADIRLAPGNSGGPLANSAGEVIGLNTLVAGGLAHAIPVSAVRRFLNETGALAA
jgi:serine protease Do